MHSIDSWHKIIIHFIDYFEEELIDNECLFKNRNLDTQEEFEEKFENKVESISFNNESFIFEPMEKIYPEENCNHNGIRYHQLNETCEVMPSIYFEDT